MATNIVIFWFVVSIDISKNFTYLFQFSIHVIARYEAISSKDCFVPRNDDNVVFTLQNKGSYNGFLLRYRTTSVVFTLQNKGSYNQATVKSIDLLLCLPFKIRAVTTINI